MSDRRTRSLPPSDAPTVLDRPGPRALDPVDVAEAPLSGEGRYQPGPLLGAGGMGEVHRCRDRRIAREVAMKTLARERADDATMRARFLLEARIQGQLEHPAVVPVY